MSKTPNAGLTRSESLSAKPRQAPFLSRRALEDGSLEIKVEWPRARWQRLLGGSKTIDRKFILDEFGREVYEACNGNRKISRIISEFAERHHLSLAEAEISVTTYLKTLMSKGVITMVVKAKNVRNP